MQWYRIKEEEKLLTTQDLRFKGGSVVRYQRAWQASVTFLLYFLVVTYGFAFTPEVYYQGSGKFAFGEGNELISDIYTEGDREARFGNIFIPEGGVFLVPAKVDALHNELNYALDVFNPLGNELNSVEEVENEFRLKDLVVVDETGDIYTAFIYARDYFELYVNGVAIAKDRVVYSPLNSNYVRFQVARPFLVSIRVVNWEDVLNLGLEEVSGISEGVRVTNYKPRIGGLLMTIVDDFGDVIAKTTSDWRAQSFYISPISSLQCVRESTFPHIIDTKTCDIKTVGSARFPRLASLHWDVPDDWYNFEFLDEHFPHAVEYRVENNTELNEAVYRNFVNIFPREELHIIWSNNIYLDNDVLFRYIVE